MWEESFLHASKNKERSIYALKKEAGQNPPQYYPLKKCMKTHKKAKCRNFAVIKQIIHHHQSTRKHRLSNERKKKISFDWRLLDRRNKRRNRKEEMNSPDMNTLENPLSASKIADIILNNESLDSKVFQTFVALGRQIALASYSIDFKNFHFEVRSPSLETRIGIGQ
jgi:hypothetical protein